MNVQCCRCRRLLSITFAFAALSLGFSPSKTLLAEATITAVMSGLDSPRGLAFGPEGGLYVVEAGRGGSGPCAVLRGQPMCYGATGALTRLRGGDQERVAVGFPSYISPSGSPAPARSSSVECSRRQGA